MKNVFKSSSGRYIVNNIIVTIITGIIASLISGQIERKFDERSSSSKDIKLSDARQMSGKEKKTDSIYNYHSSANASEKIYSTRFKLIKISAIDTREIKILPSQLIYYKPVRIIEWGSVFFIIFPSIYLISRYILKFYSETLKVNWFLHLPVKLNLDNNNDNYNLIVILIFTPIWLLIIGLIISIYLSIILYKIFDWTTFEYCSYLFESFFNKILFFFLHK